MKNTPVPKKWPPVALLGEGMETAQVAAPDRKAEAEADRIAPEEEEDQGRVQVRVQGRAVVELRVSKVAQEVIAVSRAETEIPVSTNANRNRCRK